MSISVECDSCGHRSEVADDLAGGYANCPHCHKAMQVEGFRDSLWRLWQLGILGALLLISWAVLNFAGAWPAAGVFLGGLALAWLISRAF